MQRQCSRCENRSAKPASGVHVGTGFKSRVDWIFHARDEIRALALHPAKHETASPCGFRGMELAGLEPATSWVRCILSAPGSPGDRGKAAVERRFRARRRRRAARRLGPVCLWCARLPARWSPLPAKPGHTQPTSGADRRCQGQPVRAERSQPRSGGLDCRRTAELAVRVRPCRGSRLLLQTYMKRSTLASGVALCGGALRGRELAAARPIPISALAVRRRR